MNSQDILRNLRIGFDLELDNSETYDYEIAGFDNDFDPKVLDFSNPLVLPVGVLNDLRNDRTDRPLIKLCEIDNRPNDPNYLYYGLEQIFDYDEFTNHFNIRDEEGNILHDYEDFILNNDVFTYTGYTNEIHYFRICEYPLIPPTSTPAPTATIDPTSTPAPTSTPVPTSTTTSSYSVTLIHSTTTYPFFNNDQTSACYSLDCLRDSTCSPYGSGNFYAANQYLQVGDVLYFDSGLTMMASNYTGYYIQAGGSPSLTFMYYIVGGEVMSINDCALIPTPTPTETSTPIPTSTEVPPTPTPTGTPEPTSTPSPTATSSSYSSMFVWGVGGIGTIYNSSYLTCQALDCLGVSCFASNTTTVYFNNPTPQVGDIVYLNSGLTIQANSNTWWGGTYFVNYNISDPSLNAAYKVVDGVVTEIVDCSSLPTPTETSTPAPTDTPTPTPTESITPIPTSTETPLPTATEVINSITLAYVYSLGMGSLSFSGMTTSELGDATCNALATNYQTQTYYGNTLGLGTQFTNPNGQDSNQFWVTNQYYGTLQGPLWVVGSTEYIIETDVNGVVVRYEPFVVQCIPTPTPTNTPAPTSTETPTPTPTLDSNLQLNVVFCGYDVNGGTQYNFKDDVDGTNACIVHTSYSQGITNGYCGSTGPVYSSTGTVQVVGSELTTLGYSYNWYTGLQTYTGYAIIYPIIGGVEDKQNGQVVHMTNSIVDEVVTCVTPTPTPTDTPIPTSTETPTPTSTETPTPTPTEVPIDPSNVNLQIWYDGADITQFQPTNPSDGGTITQWNDKSAIAHNANPTGGSISVRPSYEVDELCGKSGVYFDGSDGLSVNPITELQSLTGMTVFVVLRFSNTISQQTVYKSQNSDGTAGDLYLFRENTGQIFFNFTNGGSNLRQTQSPVITDTNAHLITMTFNGNSTDHSLREKLWIDGVSVPLHSNTTIGSTTPSNLSTLFIGINETLNAHMNGYIFEMLVFDRELTSGQRTSVESQLNSKWFTACIPGGAGTEVPYTTGTLFDAYSSRDGVTTTDAFNTNNFVWQLYYAHQEVTLTSGTQNIGLQPHTNGSNSWTWFYVGSNSQDTIGNWQSVQQLTTQIYGNYYSGVMKYSDISNNITIPEKTYFMIGSYGGPYYRAVKSLSDNRTAMVSGQPFVTAINKVCLGNWPSGGTSTSTLPVQLGGSDNGYTLYDGHSHVHSVTFN